MSKNRDLKGTVVEFHTQARKRGPGRRRTPVLLIAGGLLAGVLGGLVGINWTSSSASAQARQKHEFAVCGMVRRTCVIDGDSIWLDGTKIRIADIDTPEISQSKCDYEYDLGIKARDRLVALLNEGEFTLATIGNRDEDQYGRKLRVILRGGRSLGDQLVSEGLARTWTGRREAWC
ncbi:thermonuclease family protein [Erythrobacter litoralis]|uniref:thermonuclease family protein n=1 Tax=Erythrobacter litoralis TaxID=39960 RepID=UPI0024348DEE|nr:thermonuclease family protein [Erythrobacter litoralis]